MEAKLLLEDENYIASVNIYIGECQSNLSKFCNINLHSLVKGASEVNIVKLDEPHVNEYIWDLIPPQLSGIQHQVIVMERQLFLTTTVLNGVKSLELKPCYLPLLHNKLDVNLKVLPQFKPLILKTSTTNILLVMLDSSRFLTKLHVNGKNYFFRLRRMEAEQ